MSRGLPVSFLSSSSFFSLESMLVGELVVHELAGENRADTAEEVGWSWLELAEAGYRRSGEQHSYRNIAPLCGCV